MAFSISHTISEMFPHADRPKANTIRSRDGSAFAYQFGQGQGPTKANSVGSKRSLHSQHTPKAGKYPSVEQWTFFPSSIGLVNTGPGLTSLLHSPNIAWLTPPTTTSLSSTSGSVTDNRNEPKTPCRSSNPTLSKNVFTSFTPPTPRSVSLGTETAAKVAVLKTSGTPTSSDCLPSDENETRLDDEEFRPRKIFRNLTQELEAISNANTATAQIKLCLKPSLSFSFEESKPISSRTRSKVGGVCPRQVTKDNAQECPVSNGPWKTKPSYNKLEKLLELILPFSIQGRLRMNPYRCVATIGGDPSKRCASQSKGRGNPSRRKFERLVACKEEGSYDTMIQRIERLVQRTMCGSHQNVALKQPQAGARIDQLWKLLVDVAGALSDDFPEIDQWIDTICNNEASIEHVEPLFVSPTPSGRINVKVNAAPRPSTKPNKTLQKIQASYSLKFMPFLEDRTRDLTVAEALVKEIQKPLNKSDHRNGFIYIFWDKENFGRLKIGFTKDLSTRLKAWNRQCGRTHSYLSNDDRSLEDMPHVRRVERLIHVELKECREQRQCEGCGTTHIEWFRENEVHAVKVARKWQEWIMQDPYMLDKKTQLWLLKPEMLDTLEEVCRPVPRAEATSKAHSRSVRGKQSLKKPGARRTM